MYVLSLSLALIGSSLTLNAQTLKVPGGTVGSSGNSNVGINVTTPNATLDIGGTTAAGALKIITTNATGMGSPGQEPIFTTPYAFKVDFNETVYQPTGVKTTALLTHLGQWYLGDFNGAISGNHFINTKGNGIAVYGVGQNKLMFTYNGTHGNLISWETSNTSSTTRNLSFSYGGNSPFFYLIPEGKVAIATTNTPGDYKLYVGGKAIAEEVVVKLQTNWPDYVFTKNYKMLSNHQLRNYYPLSRGAYTTSFRNGRTNS